MNHEKYVIICLVLFVSLQIFLLLSHYIYSGSNDTGLEGVSISTHYKWDRVCPCLWPPNDTECLRNEKTRLFDLAIKPCIMEQSRNKKHDPRPYLYNGLHRGISSSRPNVRVKPPDQKYHKYLELDDLRDIVSTVRRGDNVPREPTDNSEFPVLLAPVGFCNPESKAVIQSDLIVLIESCVHCQKARDTARTTFMRPNLWNNFSIRFAFVTGIPSENFSDKSNSVDESGADFLDLFREAASQGDMLIANVEDQKLLHVRNQVFTFRWVSAFCSQHSLLFLFLDHSYAIFPSNLIKFVRSLLKETLPYMSAGIYGQNHATQEPPGRGFHHAWSKVMVGLPPYYEGSAYLKGFQVVTDLAIASAFVSLSLEENIYMKILSLNLRIKTQGLKHFVNNITYPGELANVTCGPAHYLNRHIDWSTGRIA